MAASFICPATTVISSASPVAEPPRHRNDRQFSGVRKNSKVVACVPMWRRRFAGFEDFFPDSDMLVFFDEPDARIGKRWNSVDISHTVLLSQAFDYSSPKKRRRAISSNGTSGPLTRASGMRLRS